MTQEKTTADFWSEDLATTAKEEKYLFEDTDIVSSYTSEEAVEDGILASTDVMFPNQMKHIVSHITSNLIDTHEYKNAASIMDLCNFIGPKIMMSKDKEFFDTYVEGPNGNKFKVFVQQNETGRYTVMLPEDY